MPRFEQIQNAKPQLDGLGPSEDAGTCTGLGPESMHVREIAGRDCDDQLLSAPTPAYNPGDPGNAKPGTCRIVPSGADAGAR